MLSRTAALNGNPTVSLPTFRLAVFPMILILISEGILNGGGGGGAGDQFTESAFSLKKPTNFTKRNGFTV
jgi:hypothetical protein